MIKNIFILLLIVICLLQACNNPKTIDHTEHGSKDNNVKADTIRKSIPKEEHAFIGNAHVTIKYHAPAVRGRTIWGGLVPYGEVWVTGAHSATSLEISKDFVVNGQAIPSGKYAFFTIPDREKWTIILNRNWEQHLADEYNTKDDVIRVEVIPEELPEIQERLQYAVVADGEKKGAITASWEMKKVSLPLEIQVQ